MTSIFFYFFYFLLFYIYIIYASAATVELQRPVPLFDIKVRLSFNLINVDWRGEFKRKVHLPSLQIFSLNRATWNTAESSSEELMASIFFYCDETTFRTWIQSSL
jgi:hypothetical protein